MESHSCVFVETEKTFGSAPSVPIVGSSSDRQFRDTAFFHGRPNYMLRKGNTNKIIGGES
ncbi:MAG: hypothetical protein MI923_17200 [Phycisphaerales bacterium]|nr:hypothetical protein [Phycisphaerales bacterium]